MKNPNAKQERLSNNFQFIDVGRNDPQKKPIHTRKTQYVEIYESFTEKELRKRSSADKILACRHCCVH